MAKNMRIPPTKGTMKDPNPRIRHYGATTAHGTEAIGTETALLVAGDREKSAITPTMIDSDPKGQITRTDKEEGGTKTETGNEETTEAALANGGEEPRRRNRNGGRRLRHGKDNTKGTRTSAEESPDMTNKGHEMRAGKDDTGTAEAGIGISLKEHTTPTKTP
jgi:hypothetical protein